MLTDGDPALFTKSLQTASLSRTVLNQNHAILPWVFTVEAHGAAYTRSWITFKE